MGHQKNRELKNGKIFKEAQVGATSKQHLRRNCVHESLGHHSCKLCIQKAEPTSYHSVQRLHK